MFYVLVLNMETSGYLSKSFLPLLTETCFFQLALGPDKGS